MDILSPLSQLNTLYSQRHCTDTAAEEESYKKEIRIRKDRKCPLSTIAARMFLLIKFYTLVINSEAFINHNHSELEALVGKIITAQYAALEGLIVLAADADATAMTSGNINGSSRGDTASDGVEVKETVAIVLNCLSLIAVRFLTVGMLQVRKINELSGVRDEFSPDEGVMSKWCIVPDGLIQRNMEWIAPSDSDRGSICNRCHYLLEASLLLSMGEAVASVYFNNSNGQDEEDDIEDGAAEEGGVVNDDSDTVVLKHGGAKQRVSKETSEASVVFSEKAQAVLLQAMTVLKSHFKGNNTFTECFITRIQLTVDDKLRGIVQPGFMKAVNNIK
jgi:hypothetical protein